jgi:hypothetical protein
LIINCKKLKEPPGTTDQMTMRLQNDGTSWIAWPWLAATDVLA